MKRKSYSKKAIVVISLLILMPFACIPVYGDTDYIKPAPVEVPAIEEIYFNHTVDINIIFIGFDGYGINTTYWDQELLDWYSPFPSSPCLYSYPIFYNYNFNYIFTNTTTTHDFFTYLDSLAVVQPDPIPSYLEGWANLVAGNYIYGIDAESIDNWLAAQFDYLPGYSLFLINSYDDIGYWYSYTFDFPDPDSGTSQYEGYMNCFAGNHTTAFYDYSTPPANYGTGFSYGIPNNVTYVPTMYESWNSTDYDAEIINQDLLIVTQFTCDFVFTPSYLYQPEPYENYIFYYLIVDCTSDYYILNNPLEFIDMNVVKESYNYLLPTVDWTYEFWMLNVTLDPTLDALITTNYIDYGAYAVLNASLGGIDDYMEDYWIYKENETTRVLPCIFFAFDKTTYYNYPGGIAAAHGKDGRGWQVVGTIDKFKTTVGTTYLSTHEAGHFLGLRHPHDGWSWKMFNDFGIGEIAYWLWDYQSTTMTYAYSYPYFNIMNKMQLYRGRTLEHLNQTYDTILEAYQTLHNRGFTEIPALFTTQRSQVQAVLNQVKIYMDSYDYITASSKANESLEEAIFLLEIAEISAVIPEFSSIPITLILISSLAVLSLIYIYGRKKMYGKTI